MELTSKQRAYLRSEAQELSSIVMVGKDGLTPSVVNALSVWVEVKVYQNGKIHFVRFENGGKTVDHLKVIGECDLERTGTTVTFKPDPTIFTETTTFDYEILKERVSQI